MIVFPFGIILDLQEQQGWLMEYWVNNCPTLVADGERPQTVWQWQHDQIPEVIGRRYIRDIPYWLQVIHSRNLRNAVDSENPNRKVHKDIPVKPAHLRAFGADPDHLPAA